MSIAIAAFAGWNDAGSAATDAISFLAEQLEAEPVASINPEEYCDFQVNRPIVRLDSKGVRRIVWPATVFHQAFLPPDRDLFLISGVEPSFHWQAYMDEFMENLADLGVDRLFLLGALLADVPHTRPVNVQVTASSPEFSEEVGGEESSYEGPTGIVGVLAAEALEHYQV
ncbi:MAG: PAC2 family protein, partial [Bifidobacteriaceae bacterium]|nr:PAC2 family protein [Bifidobacteriaceae bacterium]